MHQQTFDLVINPAQQLNGISFPSNGDAPLSAYVAIKFPNPHLNSLPIWGPSNQGVTVIREVNPRQQTDSSLSPGTRYVAQFWYSAGDGQFTGGYWGMHPYPQGGGGTAHWEIACENQDFVTTRAGNTIVPQYGQWHLQGMRVKRNNTGYPSKVLTFYPNLPNVTDSWVIERETSDVFGATEPPSPTLTIGDSPWYAAFQHERASCIHGRIKIFAKHLTESDMLAESANMSQIVTSEGQANIWWGKNNFATIDDLTCDYGTGRVWQWATSNKGTLVPINP